MLYRALLSTSLLVCSSAIEARTQDASVQLSIESGYRWDTVHSKGALTDVAFTDDGTIFLEGASGNPTAREINNLNLWQVGGSVAFLFERIIFFEASYLTGFLFSTPREIFSGSLATADSSFNHTFNPSIVQLGGKKRSSDLRAAAGLQIPLPYKIDCAFFFSYARDKLKINAGNSVRAISPGLGAAFAFPLAKRLQLALRGEYTFNGARKERITLSTHEGVDIYLPGLLTRGRFYGPALRAELIGWLSNAWRLGLFYTYTSKQSRAGANAAFGGETTWKTRWRTQAVRTSISYLF